MSDTWIEQLDEAAGISDGGEQTPAGAHANISPGKEPAVPSDHTPHEEAAAPLKLIDRTGDIFAAPAHTVLIHACNTQGIWGSGIAQAFAAQYPAAYQVYRAHCRKKHGARTGTVATGTCLLIPPCETGSRAQMHWIACLFTSMRYGKRKDSKEVILQNTGPAVREMLRKVGEKKRRGEPVAGLRMCMINSGKFGVPWADTRDVLRGIEVEEGGVGEVEIWSME